MRNSLTARQNVYSEDLESIIAGYAAENRQIASVGSNRKLGNAVSALKFPAHFTCRPGVTCDACRHCHSADPADYSRENAPEYAGHCYAEKGNQATVNSQQSYWRQVRLIEEDTEAYKQLAIAKIRKEADINEAKHVRFFDTGDWFSDNVTEVIKAETFANTDLLHMLYTKMYERANAAVEAGNINFDNTTVIISEDECVNVKDEAVNPHHLPVAVVVDDTSDTEAIKARLPEYVKKYHICPGTEVGCEACGYICWYLQLEEGVVFGKH